MQISANILTLFWQIFISCTACSIIVLYIYCPPLQKCSPPKLPSYAWLDKFNSFGLSRHDNVSYWKNYISHATNHHWYLLLFRIHVGVSDFGGTALAPDMSGTLQQWTWFPLSMTFVGSSRQALGEILARFNYDIILNLICCMTLYKLLNPPITLARYPLVPILTFKVTPPLILVLPVIEERVILTLPPPSAVLCPGLNDWAIEDESHCAWGNYFLF